MSAGRAGALPARLAAGLRQHLTAGELVGVGIDLVEVAEFEQLPLADHAHFYERCFSPDELAYCRSRPVPAQHFAARFAAKEAAVKALNGLMPLAYWQVEVTRDEEGAPGLTFWNSERTGPLAEVAQFRAFVTLTHSRSLAAAAVVVSRRT